MEDKNRNMMLAREMYVCPLTGKTFDSTIEGKPDRHEVFIQRGECPKRYQNLIFVPINCVMIRHSKHVGEGITSKDKIKLAKYLINLYGEDMIDRWLQSLPLITSPKTVKEFIDRNSR